MLLSVIKIVIIWFYNMKSSYRWLFYKIILFSNKNAIWDNEIYFGLKSLIHSPSIQQIEN